MYLLQRELTFKDAGVRQHATSASSVSKRAQPQDDVDKEEEAPCVSERMLRSAYSVDVSRSI